ncbi:MAG TPA: carboxypeptidase-like regulatory domain-containing protein, partial [Rhodothermales bacterium]
MSRALLLLLFLTFGLAQMATPDRAFGQSAVLEGTVTDGQTGTPLAGATVVFQGTSIGAATALDGTYRIPQAPVGSQILIVSYLGYETQEIPIEITRGSVNRRDVELAPDVILGGEVVVSAQAEGQIAAVNQQLASNTIVNVVSAARIQELPDANAAESVGRLPGVSILRDAGEGTKVTVRGLSPTFNAITVNGERIPATDFQDRSVDLSMISPDMLAGISVFKALTPDKDADAIGGLVNFTFRGAPAGLRSNVRLQTGYNSQSGELGQYRASVTGSNRFFSNRFGVFASGSIERADRGSDVLSAAYRIPREATEGEARAPVAIDDLILRDRLETRNRYGASLLMDYELPGGRILFTGFGSLLDRDEMSRDKQYQVSSFRTRYDLRERDIGVSVLSTSLEGEHNLFRSTWTWKLSRSSSFQEIPYSNRLRFQELAAFNDADLNEQVGPGGIVPAAKNDLSVTYLYDGRFSREDARERDYAAQSDLQIPLRAGELVSGYIKLGGKYRGKLRSRDENLHIRRFDLTGRQGPADVHTAYPERQIAVDQRGYILMENFLDPEFSADDFLDGQYELPVGLDRDMVADFYDRLGNSYLLSIFADLGDYEYTEDIGAGYAMAEINITPRLMLLPGVRYEHTWTSYDAKIGV